MNRKLLFFVSVYLLQTGILLAGTMDKTSDNQVPSIPSLIIKDAWIREAPPSAKVQAAYLRAINTGHQPVTIISISSPAFNSIESHRTTTIDGIVRMEMINEITIAPTSEVRLEPGGMHLMLFKPTRILLDGDEVELSFKLDDGSCLSTTATVRRSTGN